MTKQFSTKSRNYHMDLKYVYMDFVAPSFILIPVTIGLVKFKILPPESRTILLYLIFDALVSIVSSILVHNHLPNAPLFHLSTVIGAIFLFYFFYIIFFRSDLKKYLKISILLFPVFGLINTVFFQNIFVLNSYTLSLQAIIIIAFCFLHWWYAVNNTVKSWSAIPLNWIISGLLLYFSSSFILFTFSNVLISFSKKNISIILWNMHATLTIFMFILISIGFSKYKK